MGDVEAVEDAVEKGTAGPVVKRVERRWLWRTVGLLLGRVMR